LNIFLKLTDSYWWIVFMTWKLPKTNNELEQSFGRCGIINVVSQVAAPASLVQRVSVRLIAAVATRIRTFSAKRFATVSHPRWRCALRVTNASTKSELSSVVFDVILMVI